MTSRDIGNQISAMQTKLSLIRNEVFRNDLSEDTLSDLNTDLQRVEREVQTLIDGMYSCINREQVKQGGVS